MTLHLLGIDAEPDLVKPSPPSLLRAAKACSEPAKDKSQLVEKLDALKSILPAKRTSSLDFLPLKLLDSIRNDTERLLEDVSPRSQFWASAGDILIDIVNVRPSIGQVIYDVIAAGGDIEISAHNDPGRLSLTSVQPSGARKVLFESRRNANADQSAAA